LPIVDPSGGVQPKLSADGRVLLAMNGEIYNHLELRRELEALGVVFHSGSDTEVLANALSRWGVGALHRVIGIYAFVAFDLLKRDFVAARDPMGVKPLYLLQSGQGFLFGSEIAPLLKAAPVGDVLLLPPGHILSKAGCFFLRAPPSHSPNDGTAPTALALDSLLRAAVKRRIPTDVPFAILFSGGIDSTLVAHYARESAAGAPGYFLRTPQAPDLPFAACYAEATGLDLRIVELDANPTVERIRGVVATCETYEPDVVRNTYCTSALAKAAHDDGFRVVLSGEGADELFAGYPPLEASYAASDEIGANLREQHLETMHKSNLQRLDRGGMAWQVEIREPFLDPSIIAYARRLGRDALLAPGADGPQGKQPLRALYDLYPDALPAMIRDRRKIPMGEGVGFDKGPRASMWADFAEGEISDREFAGRGAQFPGFDIVTKEEQLYLRCLAESLDIGRVPHLTARHRMVVPNFPGLRDLSAYLRPQARAS